MIYEWSKAIQVDILAFIDLCAARHVKPREPIIQRASKLVTARHNTGPAAVTIRRRVEKLHSWACKEGSLTNDIWEQGLKCFVFPIQLPVDQGDFEISLTDVEEAKGELEKLFEDQLRDLDPRNAQPAIHKMSTHLTSTNVAVSKRAKSPDSEYEPYSPVDDDDIAMPAGPGSDPDQPNKKQRLEPMVIIRRTTSPREREPSPESNDLYTANAEASAMAPTEFEARTLHPDAANHRNTYKSRSQAEKLEEENAQLRRELARMKEDKKRALIVSQNENRELHNIATALRDELAMERQHPSRNEQAGAYSNEFFQEFLANKKLKEKVQMQADVLRLLQRPDKTVDSIPLKDIANELEYVFSQCDVIFPTSGVMCPRMPRQDVRIPPHISQLLSTLINDTTNAAMNETPGSMNNAPGAMVNETSEAMNETPGRMSDAPGAMVNETNETTMALGVRDMIRLGNAHDVVCVMIKIMVQLEVLEKDSPKFGPESPQLSKWKKIILLQKGESDPRNGAF